MKPISEDLRPNFLFDDTEVQVLEEATEMYEEQIVESRSAICADNTLSAEQLKEALENIFYKHGAIKRVRRWIEG